MVNLQTVRQENTQFASEKHGGLVFVFAGATSGIGASTLEKMVTMVENSTFYIIGRSEARFAAQRDKLESLNPSNKIEFLQAEFSLISDVDAISKKIMESEKKVDYLFMSPGMYPLNGAAYTKEGLEVCMAVSYYSRIRLLTNLLPLLRQSSNARVLAVLGGGREQAIDPTDIGLQQKWSSRAAINHTISMTSLTFNHLAENDKKMTFVHSSPGLVRTNIMAQKAPEGSSWLWMIQLAALRVLFAVLMSILGTSVDESGERKAFLLTSDKFGPGAHLVGDKCEESVAPTALVEMRENGMEERVWEHTVGVFENVGR